MREQIELSNEAASALSGSADSVLRDLESQVDCSVFLRGNVVTLDGEPAAVSSAATLVREMAGLADSGHEIRL